MIPMNYYLAVGAALFAIGLVGVLTRRNLLIVYMSIELMLNAVNINFITFAHYFDRLQGDIIALFVITVAAAEPSLALVLLFPFFGSQGTVIFSGFNYLNG